MKGPIPSDISRLLNFSNLDLFYNSLTGVIPSVLFTIPSLSTLYLDQNHLTSLLKFQSISSSPLYELRLSENKLNESIPRSIANFTKLQRLYLSSINLKGKVELNTFFGLKELKDLDLSGNKVLVSKTNINSTLPKFSSLWLSSCNLLEFPAFLEAQNELQYLDLSNNNIEGNIPKWFWNVGKETLEYLNLSYNFLSKFEQPPVVLPWKKNVHFRLEFQHVAKNKLTLKNKLTGSIPQ